ncbi:MAG: hypothetical protein HYX57_09025 [Chloroflexi bacterium]|nr:hypothetical protein [Chloroflexota bacterium]
MSRRRWLVLLGPPFLIAAAAAPLLSGRWEVRVGATSLAPARPIAACDAGVASRAGGGLVGAWWRTSPQLDADGSLGGWQLEVGAAGTRRAVATLPAAATISGPRNGRVVVAIEGQPSLVRVVDPARGCAREVTVADRIVRRAVADPTGDGVLAHLLEPGTRRDLGVWRIGPDGGIGERVLEPLRDGVRDAAGIDRVWATDLVLDVEGGRLAVQSCDPEACLSRIVELVSGRVTTLAAHGQGPLVGFAGASMVTWAACSGFPCPVLAWDASRGEARVLAEGATGAALTSRGDVLVTQRIGADGGHLLDAMEIATGRDWQLPAAFDGLPLNGSAGMTAGLETGDDAIGLADANGLPTALSVETEVQR